MGSALQVIGITWQEIVARLSSLKVIDRQSNLKNSHKRLSISVPPFPSSSNTPPTWLQLRCRKNRLSIGNSIHTCQQFIQKSQALAWLITSP